MIAKTSMQIYGFAFVCLMRILCCIKKSKVIIYSISPNMGLPFLSGFVPRHTFKARFVCNWLFDIFHVFKTICFSKIYYPVISSDPIDVVNFIFRPHSIRHSPCNSMGSKKNIVNSDDDIPRSIKTCYLFPGITFSALYSPKQISRFWVVRKKLIEPMHFWVFHGGNMATFNMNVNWRKY